jgi:hypothetical protein
MKISQIRTRKRDSNHMIRNTIKGEANLVEVDTTWGSIQPMQAVDGVLTVGELKVYHYQQMECTIG